MQDTLLYIGAFILSVVCGFIFIPIITKFCVSKGIFDQPSRRKVHKKPIPRLGGIAFIPSMLIATAIVLFVLNKQDGGLNVSLWSVYFCISLFMIYFTGIIDDIAGLSANIKFIVEIVAATILPSSGLYINNLYGLFGIYTIPFWVGMPLTILMIVFTCNAINLIDGIDGLSAALTLIALTGFFIGFYNDNLFFYCIMIVALMGVLIPYLYFNMFGKEEKGQKIFMGDSGSLSLGFVLGFLCVKYCMDTPRISYNPMRILWAWTLLAVPGFDLIRVFFYRLMHKMSPFHPDKNHIHHKLMAAGMNQHMALLAIIGLQLATIAISGLLSDAIPAIYVIVIQAVLYLGFITSMDIVINRKALSSATPAK